MQLLGLHYAIWLILALYFAGMLALGWLSRRGAHTQEGYLIGNRGFGTLSMVMHAFGAGTNPGDAAGVITATVRSGVSGVWISWMWLFGTPFYWLIAPVIRRMRYLTMADFYEKRFGRAACILYIAVASTGMVVFLGGVMLATTRTVQGMMGKPGDAWFFGILTVSTAVFLVYSYWGGIVAAVRTDMVQGLMIIALSIIAIPAALNTPQVGGLGGMLDTLAARKAENPAILNLFDPNAFDIWTVLLLTISAPLTALAFPHLITVCGAGKTEWHGRVGFTCGNLLKRLCTIGWSLLGLAWLVWLLNSNAPINTETAFGDSIRQFLSPVLQGIMLACIMAAAMSSGDAVQVTVAGLFSQNLYAAFIRPNATDAQRLAVTRYVGVAIALIAFAAAVAMRSSIVKAVLDYFNILSLIGICTAMGILWRRMNTGGVFLGAGLAVASFILTRYCYDCPRVFTFALPILTGLLGGITGSLLTRPAKPEIIDDFYKRIYTPIGREDRLSLPLDQAVPPQRRLLTAGGLFLVKPSAQSIWGLLITLGVCLACVAAMLILLNLRL